MPEAPFQKVWKVGDVVTAADLNANIRDGYNYVLKDKPVARGSSNAVTTVPNGVWTNINFQVEQYDSIDNTFSLTGSMNIVVGGIYLCTGTVSFLSNSTGGRAMRFTVNGNAQVGIKSTAASPTTDSMPTSLCMTRQFYLPRGSVLRIQGFQTSGGNLDAKAGAEGSSLQVVWLSSDTFLR